MLISVDFLKSMYGYVMGSRGPRKYTVRRKIPPLVGYEVLTNEKKSILLKYWCGARPLF